jgi:hypothetical protein
MNRTAAAGAGMITALLLSGCSHDLNEDSKRAPAAVASDPPAVTMNPTVTATQTGAPNPIDTASPPSLPLPGKPQVVAPFRWHVAKAARKDLGASWHTGCPVGPADLRVISLRYWSFDGRVHDGVIVVNKSVLRRLRAVFATMYQRKFPLRSVIPVHKFTGASDDASMAADNTSAFNCRLAVAAGPPAWSRHAYGIAIDVNPVENPYFFGKRVLPPAGAKYRDRSKPHPGVIRKGDPIYKKFIATGFHWGGAFSNPDYQHFER